MAKTLMFLGEEGQKYALPSVFTDGYSLVSGDIFDCEDDTLADALLLETGRRGGPLFAETSDPATVFPPLVVVPPIGGGGLLPVDTQTSEDEVSITSSAEREGLLLQNRFIASYDLPNFAGVGVFSEQRALDSTDEENDKYGVHRQTTRYSGVEEELSAGQSDALNGTYYSDVQYRLVTEAMQSGTEYTESVQSYYERGGAYKEAIRSIDYSSFNEVTLSDYHSWSGGTHFEETISPFGGEAIAKIGNYQGENEGDAIVYSSYELGAGNRDSYATLRFETAVNSPPHGNYMCMHLQGVDTLVLEGVPLATPGTETPALGALAPVAGLVITGWIKTHIDGVDGFIPFFSVPE